MPENDAPISKSQAIKQYLAEHPDASPTTIAEALVAQGIQVTPVQVSVVRTVLQSSKPADEESEARHIHITITPPPERSPSRKKKSPRKKPAASGGTTDVKTVFEATRR